MQNSVSHRNFERILHFRVSPGSMSVSVSVNNNWCFIVCKSDEMSEYGVSSSSRVSPLKYSFLCVHFPFCGDCKYKGVYNLNVRFSDLYWLYERKETCGSFAGLAIVWWTNLLVCFSVVHFMISIINLYSVWFQYIKANWT